MVSPCSGLYDRQSSVFTGAAKTHVIGQYGGELSGGGNYDPTATTGPEAILESIIAGGVSVPVVFKPGGGTASPAQRTRSFDATLTSFKEGSKIGGKVTFGFTFLMNGPITYGATD